MKRTLYLLAGFAATLAACKKSDLKLTPLASINIVNATVNSTAFITNTTHNTINFANNPVQIGFGSNAALAMVASNAVPLSITDLADTTKAAYKTTLTVNNGDYYSLFLAGQTGAVDAILVKDSYKTYADSVCGVRFINLSSDSQPVSVDIAGSANGSEVRSLAYKANGGFKSYPSNSTINSYNFEFRDLATGNLLAAFTLSPTPTHHNVTLALIGLENGGGVSVQQINNY